MENTMDPKAASHVEHLEAGTSQDDMEKADALIDARINAFTPEEQKKIIRKTDLRLVTTLGALYCIYLMDRNNLGIAMIAGMGVDLQLTGNRYSIVILLLFITYVLLQPVAVVIMRKIGPRIFLSTTCLLWGLLMMCFGFVRRWTDLIGLRLVLGILEAGVFPGCVYLLSCWYTRYELQSRYAWFYVLGCIVSGFSGILGYAFSLLKDHGAGPWWWGQHYGPTAANPDIEPGVRPGIAGWRWIFIIYGLITCLLGIATFVLLVDFPEKATKTFLYKFLNQTETDFVVARIEEDRKDTVLEPFNLRKYLRSGLDLKIWGFAACFGMTTMSITALVYFLPIILRDGMGFSVAAAQCLTAPPYVFGTILMLVCAHYGDKHHIRSPFILLNCVLLFIGLALLGYVQTIGVRYFGGFLVAGAANANAPCVLAWQANNIRGQWKRAFCSATIIGTGGLGAIVGALCFRSQDAPKYLPGIWACLTATGLMTLIVFGLNFKFYRANQRARNGGKPIEGLQGFLYTY
ncbi:phthalate transporter [Cladophialophora carrionii]|uniref:Phthalate transporter n=1 Tax=Cladophialophora carrionii TaxID=86049 RepID=A0A1C1CLS5_9EURO|nr:phthalate transporter [Cladophialophora carrionii]